jgi:hypothetical protein
MRNELVDEIFALIETQVKCRPSPIEFEMAYQVRVAIERIRFAIKATDQFAHHPQQLQEVGLQLLDALDRLESADRDFQRRFRRASALGGREPRPNAENGKAASASSGGPA